MLFTLLLALSCQGGPHSGPRVLRLPAGGTELALLDSGGRPVIEAQIGGAPVRLLVDTGSTLALLLEPGACERLQLTSEERRLLPELALGEAVLEDVPVLSFAALPAAWRLDGILGFPALRDCLWTFDHAAHVLRLTPGTLAGAEGTIPFRQDGELGFGITLDLEVAGTRVPVHLDTGSPELALFSNLLLDELPLAGTPRAAGRANTPMGGADLVEAELRGELRLGPVVHRAPSVRFGDLPQIAGRRLGNIGARFLEGTRLTIDARAGLLKLESPAAQGAESAPTQERLSAFAGRYRIEGKLFRAPGAAPERLDGRATWEASADGRRRHERFELDGRDGPLRGEAWLGPAGTRGALELVQIDAFQPQMVHVQGGWSDDGRRIELAPCAPAPGFDGPRVPPLRWVYRFEDAGVIVKELHVAGPDGSFRLSSEYRYVPEA